MHLDDHVFPAPAGTASPGIALRDWLAALAMQGFVTRGLEVKADRFMSEEEKDDEIATRAYRMADAMLRVKASANHRSPTKPPLTNRPR